MANRNKLWLAAALLVSTWLGSCTKELKLPDIGGKPKLVLLGELISGDSVYFRAGESVPVSSGSTMRFGLPANLSVTLQSAAGTAGLHTHADSWSSSLNTLAVSGNQQLLPGFSYKIEVSNNTLGTARCEFEMPVPFQAQVLDTSSLNVAGSKLLKARISFTDNGGDNNYYVVEAVKQSMGVEAYFNWNGNTYSVSANQALYQSLKASGNPPPLTYDTSYFRDMVRIPIYTDDGNTENAKLGNTLSPNKRILLTDKTFNGGSYTTSVFIDKSIFKVGEYETRGRILLWIKSVPEPYFKFLRAYESFESVTGWGSLAQPRKMEGNVNGGLGMMGSAARIQYVYLYDRWTF